MPQTIPYLASVLALLAALGPFSIDTYLPAFPAMAQSLAASELQIQQTLTAYFLPFSFMVLWHGALSDRFGRRPVILLSLLVYALASLVCMIASSVEMLWLGRALQGISAGAGVVVGRAIVRDCLDGADAQRLMARVAILFAVSPAIAPIVGGWIFALAGWRAVFAFLAIFGFGLLLLTWRRLPETLALEHRHSLHPVTLAQSYGRAFGHRQFLLLCAALACNFGGFFIYVVSAPAFLMKHLGVSPQGFGWLFVPAVVGMMGGSWLSGRLAGKMSAQRTAVRGFGAMGLAALGNVVLNFLAPPGLPWSVLPIGVYTFGMALAMPSLTLLALDIFPRQRGLAASCQSFIQLGGNVASAAIIAPLVWGSTRDLAASMLVWLLLGCVCFAAARLTAPAGSAYRE